MKIINIKVINNYAAFIDTPSGESIRVRDITEYNEETQRSYYEYMEKYNKKGIAPSRQTFSELVKELEEEGDS